MADPKYYNQGAEGWRYRNGEPPHRGSWEAWRILQLQKFLPLWLWGLNPMQTSPTQRNRAWKRSPCSIGQWESVRILSAWETVTEPSQGRELPLSQQQTGELASFSDCWRAHSAIHRSCGRICWLHPAMMLKGPLFSGKALGKDPVNEWLVGEKWSLPPQVHG